MKEEKLVPELRFPEFEGLWLPMKLGDISSKIGSGSTPRGGEEVYQTEGIPFIRSQNVLNNELVLDNTHIPTEVHIKMNGSKVIPGDILLNITGGSIGRTCVVPKDFKEGNVNQHVSIIRLKKFNSKFLQSILSSHTGRKLVFQGMTGSGREGLNFESIRNFKIYFPTLPEQQKIATFLTSVDKRIQLLTQKKEKLEEYKKGVMQGLFSGHGQQQHVLAHGSTHAETHGRASIQGNNDCVPLWFTDQNGNNYPDWEEKKLGEVAEINGGGTPETVKSEYWNGNINWFTPTEIKQKYITKSNRTITELGLKNSSAKVLPEKTLLFTSRATIGDVGIAMNKCTTNQGFQSFMPNDNYVTEFLYYWIRHNKKAFIRKSSGSTFIEISKSAIQKIKILLPSIPEQQKIATFLSALDKQIEQVGGQVAKMKEWKKGLLQKMFV